MKRPFIVMPAILFLLVLLIVSPSILAGIQSERNARTALVAGDHLYAAQQFELAAQRLFWKPALWDEAGDAYYFSGGELDKMRVAYENAEKHDALGACGWDALGAIYSYQQNDPELTLQTWLAGLAQFPEDFVLNLHVAIEYNSRGDNELEKEYLLSTLAHGAVAKDCFGDPVETASIYYRLGTLLIPDNPSQALDELITASRLDEEYTPVVEILRTSLNLASLESDPAEKLILIGRGFGLAEEWKLAADAFYDATQADPESASAWAWLGQAQYQLGEDAQPSFDKAASVDPNSLILLSLRGLYFQQQNDFEAALTDFEKLAALEPENPIWQTSLGAVYAELGDLPTALAAYERAVELEPASPTYRQLLALFSFDYSYDLEGIGVSAARRAVILSPEDAKYIDTLGLVYLGLDRDDDAEKQFQQALEKDAEYAAAHLHLGMLYLKRGHRELAYTALLRAEELDPDGVVGVEVARLLEEFFQ